MTLIKIITKFSRISVPEEVRISDDIFYGKYLFFIVHGSTAQLLNSKKIFNWMKTILYEWEIKVQSKLFAFLL